MRIGYIVGSLSSTSINRRVAEALAALAPEGVDFVEIPIKDLPLYTPDADADYPQSALDWKSAIESVDGVVIITPEYLRSIPGALKNAIDWASRPWGTNSFNGKPVAIAGVSVGAIGTAAAQQHLRAILGHLNAPTMGQPEVFLQYHADAWDAEGALIDERTTALLQGFLSALVTHVDRHARVDA
jgi:chromate reductase, NAD(P)H dehydrogenase (quinone)